MDKSIERVLLINPPGKIMIKEDGQQESKLVVHPLGLAYIAAVLRNDYEVICLDALAMDYKQLKEYKKGDNKVVLYGLSYEQISERIENVNPDIIGISCLFSNRINEVFEIAKRAKRSYPQVPVVLGGGHPSALPKEMLSKPFIDYVVIGEGEITLRDLLSALNGQQDISEIDGLAYRGLSGAVRINPKRHWIEDLDNLPFPAWDLLPMNKYWEGGMPPTKELMKEKHCVICTSRGCPHKCSFCTTNFLWGKKFRQRSVENVLDEIEYLVNTFGIEEIHVIDDNFAANPTRAKKILDAIYESFPDLYLKFPNGLGLGTIDEELVLKFKWARCYQVCLAIESGCEEIQKKYIDNKVKLNEVARKVELFKKHGIKTYGFFIIGFPEETIKQIEETIRFAQSLPLDDVNFFCLMPLPGTPIFQECIEKGILVEGFDVTNVRAMCGSTVTKEFNPTILENIRRKAWLEFYEKKRQRGG